jgi:uracil-DNA glycosylase
MTRRRSAYRSISSLQRDNRVCRACADEGFPLESLPVVQPYTGQRAYIHGQAPGALEGEQRLPWRGRAGRTLRRWLDMDEDEFYDTFYCASVTRCYPGKSLSGSGDRTPTPREQELCSLWREWELRLIRPELILAVGGLSARRLLGVTSFSEHIGRRFDLAGAVTIPLPHPSGTSRWLNDPANRERLAEALVVVKDELARFRTAPPPSSP